MTFIIRKETYTYMFSRILSYLSDLGALLSEGIWTVLSMFSVLIALIIMIHRINHYKGDMIFTPFRCIFAGAFVSLFIWWLPLELGIATHLEGLSHGFNAVMGALHGSLAFFLLEGGVDQEVQEYIASAISSEVWRDVHFVFGRTMSVLAPLLTFGFILTFFRNLLNHISYRIKVFFLHPRVHVFSELNERSLALARSIDREHNYRKKPDGTKTRKIFFLFRRDIIVFTDVFEKNEEEHSDLFDKAHELGAIVFKKDIASIRFFKKNHHFYLISEKESEELRHAESIIDRYSQYKYPEGGDYFLYSRRRVALLTLKLWANSFKRAVLSLVHAKEDGEKKKTPDVLTDKIKETHECIQKILETRRTGKFKRMDAKVYIFSNGSRGKSFLDSYDNNTVKSMELKVVRVNDIRALIYDDLDKNGMALFENAKGIGETRVINAVIVGLGMYGLEMLKSLLWYCQLPGYKINIKAFDENADIVSRFNVMCPSINLEQDTVVEGDMQYSVGISCAKVGTKEFKEAILECKDTTFVFVCLGDDGVNISTSVDIRSWLEQEGKRPSIKTVVYNSGLKSRMTSNPDDKHNIEIIGDVDGFYSSETVINSALSVDALEVHKRWNGNNCNPNSLYMSEYGYYSSLANALHRRLRAAILTYGDRVSAEYESIDAVKDGKKRGIIERRYQNKDKIFARFGDMHSTIHKVISLANANCTLTALGDRLTRYDNYCSAAIYSDEAQELAKAGRVESLERVLKMRAEQLKGSGNDADAAEASVYESIVESLDKDPFEAILEALFCGASLDGFVSQMKSVRRELCLPDRQYDFFKLDEVEQKRIFDKVKGHIAAIFSERAKKIAVGEVPEGRTKALASIDLDLLGVSSCTRELRCGEKVAASLSDVIYAYTVARTFATVEHVRWNAYMRTEGFVYNSNKDVNHKMHYNLVPVDGLCFSDYVKDL